MDRKDATAIFFFEEAIKADPNRVQEIIAIAKRSPGYSGEFKKRVEEEERQIL